MTGSRPVLWHLDVSHYSEKVRWALDYKQVPHRRRAVPVPGLHIPASLWLTRGESQTYPVLELDGRTIGDSTAIIAALEERYPEPALYPSDPQLRQQALELEDFFDEEVAPHARLLAFHELGNDRERFQEMIGASTPPFVARMGAGAVTYARTYTGLRFGVRHEEAAALAREKLVAGFDRLDAELDGGDYLVGEQFSVADLSAAALLYPLVLPPGGPLPSDQVLPEGFERFRAPLQERPGYRWVEETYRQHRQPSNARTTAASHG